MLYTVWLTSYALNMDHSRGWEKNPKSVRWPMHV